MNRRILAKESPPGRLRLFFTYDEALVATIKGVPGRTWDSMSRSWSIPFTPEAVDHLRRRLDGVSLELAPAAADKLAERIHALDTATAVKHAGDSDIAYDYITEPYAHQRAGLKFLATLGGGALLWEMGTGKTKTAIDFCELLGQDEPFRFRVLVICPNTVKRNWGEEIEKHAGHLGYDVLDGSIRERCGRLAKTRYTIVNCEALSLTPFAKAAQDIAWDVVIVDESTRFKTPDAKRTKALHKLQAAHRLILTGTPITGKPEDAWAQFQFLEPGIFGTWWSFVDRYMVKDFFKAIVGIKPGMEQQLATTIASRSYRVLKRDVLDLPPKVYADRRVELTGDQKRAYEQMRHDLIVTLDETPTMTASTILTQLLRLTQITSGLIGQGDTYTFLDKGNAKLDELDHLLREELAGEQVVIFAMYQKELEALWLRYAPNPTGHDEWDLPAILYGPTPEHRRQSIINAFQSGDRRLLFAQQRTGGIGINLTAARTAIYYTRGWSLEEYLQSQDRLHRIGQRGTVSILHLVAAGTVDEDIAKALATKQRLADTLTGDAARRLAASVLERKLP